MDETHGKLCPEGDGGNSTITNQDEQLILNRTTQGLQTRAEGMQEPGKH
jgi:hypothetical protein